MPLKYPPFAASLRMQEASRSNPSLRLNSRPGTNPVTSKNVEVGCNTQRESQNWFFAIGGYSSWGKGVATVADGPTGRSYQVDFEYKFYDRYNWDAGKSVTFAGVTVTDKFMGEFHRQGIAKEYDCNGSFKRRFTWTKGQRIAQAQLDAPGDGDRA
jgi:hypothetical protein